MVALRGLAAEPPSLPDTHVALAGTTSLARRLLEEGAWDRADGAVRDGWQRDRALLDVAGKAREARTTAAWRKLVPAP